MHFPDLLTPGLMLNIAVTLAASTPAKTQGSYAAIVALLPCADLCICRPVL